MSCLVSSELFILTRKCPIQRAVVLITSAAVTYQRISQCLNKVYVYAFIVIHICYFEVDYLQSISI